jgi:RNA polymerase sigma factor (sigma-70 family)
LNDLDAEDRLRFEQLVLPHVDAAFNLARWLLSSREDAEDVAQEALLRACRFFRGFHGGDARAWLLQIVRNTCYSWLEKNRPRELMVEFDEELHPQPLPLRNPSRSPRKVVSVSPAPWKPCRHVSAKSLSFENSKAVPTRRSPRLHQFPSVQ